MRVNESRETLKNNSSLSRHSEPKKAINDVITHINLDLEPMILQDESIKTLKNLAGKKLKPPSGKSAVK